ncbi:SxtJ family membrane protein [Colwellia piezophila]|uniref:SxtJ family membrane protein n=1 Tax=Colwellia piezophila TaxID=211668 RepID=UPI000367C764|nr:SxtJ family membrane protein [Colwellia piezophila]
MSKLSSAKKDMSTRANSKASSKPKMSNQELKAFGILMAWAFPLFIGVIAPWLLGAGLQWWTLWVSAFFISLSLLAPNLIYFPYKVWMFIGGIVGFINTRIILGVTFYLLIFPIGLILSAFNKLQYKNKCTSHSNYVKRTDKLTKKQLENPF